MKKIFFLIFISFSMKAAAQDAGTARASQRPSAVEIKKMIAQEKNPLKLFNLKNDLLAEYSSMILTREILPEIRSEAEAVLKKSGSFRKEDNYGNALHHAHIALGRAAFFEGDILQARKQLKLAAENPGSAWLKTQGPNMKLAKELLGDGEKEVVKKYIESCLKFWKGPLADSESKAWKAAIAQDQIPDFGSHLAY